jgi:excinuclease ABC subunit B
LGVKCRYIHSDVDTIERVELLRDLRLGEFDVLVGINLLREGLDLPEVSLVAILDADKEGFLRSERSLTQTAGRAARHLEGRVIFYADKMTDSMKRTISETERRRTKQIQYNTENNIIPTPLIKTKEDIMEQSIVATSMKKKAAYDQPAPKSIAAEPGMRYASSEDLKKRMEKTRKMMEVAAKDLDFVEAARLRDEMKDIQALMT